MNATTNTETTLQIGEYTVTVYAKYHHQIGRNDTGDFLNWLSILLADREDEDWEKESKEYAHAIYEHLSNNGFYDKFRKE